MAKQEVSKSTNAVSIALQKIVFSFPTQPYLALVLPLLLLFLLIYWPASNQGFLRDDFGWISMSRVFSWHDVGRVFFETRGFFRPLVSFSFSLNYFLFGLHPLGYYFTNLLLILWAAFLLYRLTLALGLHYSSALFAALVWLFNPHGINMALLWISGRTSLLLALFSLLAALCMLRKRPLAMGLFTLCAMLSKEEAIALPIILILWLIVRNPGSGRDFLRANRLSIPCCLISWPVYFYLRSLTNSYLPGTAPTYYQLKMASFLRNILEYADRSMFIMLLFIILVWLIASRKRIALASYWRELLLGLIWACGAFALTIFLPVRSSLYAVYPALGTALIAAVFFQTIWNSATDPQKKRTAIVLLVLPWLLFPIYNQRNKRWREPAQASFHYCQDFQHHFGSIQGASLVVLKDIPDKNHNLSAAFSSLILEAARLYSNNSQLNISVEPAMSELSASAAASSASTVHFKVINRRLSREN